mmetsp:Transcript_64124/g.95109  ORF Transcript_64124/g.95109 Transcript_64124/m.95109 type:complete len:83 (-) Transcript_64124:198-446(-)
MPMAVMQVKRNLKKLTIDTNADVSVAKGNEDDDGDVLECKKDENKDKESTKSNVRECHAFPSDLNMYCAQTYLNLFVVNGKR